LRRTAKLAGLSAERIAILAIAALAGAVFLVVVLWFVQERERIREAGFQTGSNLAHILQEEIYGSVMAVDLTLQYISEALTLRPGLADHDPAFHAFLRRNLSRLPPVHTLFVVGPDGFITHDSGSPRRPGVSVKDRAYFTTHEEYDTFGLFVGPPIRSRANNAWFMALSRRIDRPDGSFGGVVVAAIEVDRFAELYKELRLGPQDAVALFLQDGTLLFRAPGSAASIGESMRNIRPFDGSVPKGTQGAFRSEVALDNAPRLVSYRALDEYPIVVSVALSEDALLAPWRRNAMIAASVVVVLATCMAILMVVLIRLRRHLEHVHERRLQMQRLETLGRMTGGIAHDVNNILAVIASGTQLLKRSDIVNKEVLGRITDAVARGRDLVLQLLSFAKSETLEIGTVDLAERIERLRPLMRQAAGAAIEISVQLPPHLSPCRADATRFDAAMLNLVVNARDAMPSGGRITMTARDLPDEDRVLDFNVPAGDYVELCVADTGEGMSPETARKAIEPFFSTKGAAGTGLGLSQVYGFMQQIGGDLAIETKLGEGTAVHLVFLRAGGHEEARAAPEPRRVPASGR